jgi:Rieske Fe-S protein
MAQRRLLLQAVTVSMLTLVFPFIAQAAGPNLKAIRVGQRVVWRGYIYTVVKSKGKLVWKRGSKVAVATASATPKPSFSASANSTPSPTTTPAQTQTPAASPTPNSTADGIFVGNSSEVREGQVKIIEINIAKNQYASYAFSRLGGKLSAVSVICTHAGCKVVAEKTELVCNCHMSIFSPIDGAAQSGPARLPLTRYVVTERDGKIYIQP